MKEKGEKGYLRVLYDPTHHVPALDQWLAGKKKGMKPKSLKA